LGGASICINPIIINILNERIIHNNEQINRGFPRKGIELIENQQCMIEKGQGEYVNQSDIFGFLRNGCT
jgi:hypothetical protein